MNKIKQALAWLASVIGLATVVHVVVRFITQRKQLSDVQETAKAAQKLEGSAEDADQSDKDAQVEKENIHENVEDLDNADDIADEFRRQYSERSTRDRPDRLE